MGVITIVLAAVGLVTVIGLVMGLGFLDTVSMIEDRITDADLRDLSDNVKGVAGDLLDGTEDKP